MSCCCQRIYSKFCAVGTCENDVISLGFAAQLNGEYKLTVSFLGAEYEIKKTFAIGATLDFPTSQLNESAEMLAQLRDPNGAIVSFVVDTIEYDCFIISTKITYSL